MLQGLDLSGLKCPKGGHYNGLQNIVCIAKDCPDRGLICIYCLSRDHTNHQFLGLEQYLETVLQYRGHEIQHSRRLSTLKSTLKDRYTRLQLKISELSSSLEILTHQVKRQFEFDLDQLAESTKQIQQLQTSFIALSAGEDNEITQNDLKSPLPSTSSAALRNIVEASLKCISYNYDDKVTIHMNGYEECLQQLDQYEQRFNSIEEVIKHNLLTIQKSSEEILNLKENSDSQVLQSGFGDIIKQSDNSQTIVHSISFSDAHLHRISGLVLLNESTLYSSSQDGYLRRWNLKSKECTRVQKLSDSQFWLAAVYLNRLNCLVALASDNTLHLINSTSLKTLKKVGIPSKHSSCPLLIKVPGRPTEIAVASGDTIFVIDLLTEMIMYAASSNGYYIYSFDIWTDGNYKYIIYGDKSGKLYADEMKTQSSMRTIELVHQDKVLNVKVLPNTNYILTSSTDSHIQLWKMPTMEPVGTWKLNGFIDGIYVLNDNLVVKEKDSDRLHVIYQDSNGSCKKKQSLKIRESTEGLFVVNNITRSIVTCSFSENRETGFSSSDIFIDYY